MGPLAAKVLMSLGVDVLLGWVIRLFVALVVLGLIVALIVIQTAAGILTGGMPGAGTSPSSSVVAPPIPVPAPAAGLPRGIELDIVQLAQSWLGVPYVFGGCTRPLIDSVVRSICGREVEQAVRLTGGGMSETYRVDLQNDMAVVVRIARQPVPWFTDEDHLSAQVRSVGVPTPEVLGVEQVEHDGELLSVSIQRLVPGRTLDELAGELPASDLARLIMDSGELLARVHSIAPGRGMRHEIQSPDEVFVGRLARNIDQAFGPAAAASIERGADLLRKEVMTRPAPRLALSQGDWMPKNLLIDDGAIVGVIDWEFAGPASPAFDFARWEVSAGDPLQDRTDLLRRGYARVTDPDAADAGWVPAFAIDWALEKLGWKNPATLVQQRRCLDVIARYVGH